MLDQMNCMPESRTAQRGPVPVSAFSVVLAILGALMILMGTSRYGIGLSADSVSYIHCARTLAAGHGFQSLDESTPFTLFPPLYPLVLSLPGLFGVNPLAGARWINALLYALLILASHRLFQIHLKEAGMVVLATISALFCMHLVSVGLMAWSETLFALIVVLLCIQLERLVLAPSRGALGWAILWAALAALCRYAGLALIGSGTLVILMLQQSPARQRLKQALIFSAAAGMPVLIWMLRNFWIGGGFTGRRTAACVSLAETLAAELLVFSRWAAPAFVPYRWRLIILAVAAGGLTWATVRLWLNRRSAACEVCRMAVLPTVLGFYIVFITFAAITTKLDPELDRFFSVVFIPAVCYAFSLCAQWKQSNPGAKPGRWIVSGACLLWSACSLSTAFAYMHFALWEGAGGFSTYRWHSSPMLTYLKEKPLEGVIYTNGNDVLYILNNQKAKRSPKHQATASHWEPPMESAPPIHLVWFNQILRPYLATPDELGAHCALIPDRRFADGTIYTVKDHSPQRD
jgi:hypothetical protein